MAALLFAEAAKQIGLVAAVPTACQQCTKHSNILDRSPPNLVQDTHGSLVEMDAVKPGPKANEFAARFGTRLAFGGS